MHAYIDASIHSTISAERKDKETNGTREPSYVAFLVHPDGDELSNGGWLHIYSSPSVSRLKHSHTECYSYYIHQGCWSFCAPHSSRRRCYITVEHNRGCGRLNQPFGAQTGFPHSVEGSPHHLHLHLKHSKTGAHNPACGGGGGLQWVAAAVCEKSALVADKR